MIPPPAEAKPKARRSPPSGAKPSAKSESLEPVGAKRQPKPAKPNPPKAVVETAETKAEACDFNPAARTFNPAFQDFVVRIIWASHRWSYFTNLLDNIHNHPEFHQEEQGQ